MSGHVDDFNRAGDMSSPVWQQARAAIDDAYKWGSTKSGSYRHVGADIEVKQNAKDGKFIEINQDFYVETLQNVAIPEHRLRDDGSSTLSSDELAACRAALGSLQWLPVQTQPQLCARCN